MAEKNEVNTSRGWGEKIKTIVLLLGQILALVTPLAKPIYQEYFASPKIQYTPEEERDVFEVPDSYRGVSLLLRPQLIVQSKNDIIQIIALHNYYDDENIKFTGTTGIAKKINGEHIEALRFYIYQSILEELKKSYSSDVVEEIRAELKVYISLLGGVEYQNARGDTINQYCVIGKKTFIQDYPKYKRLIRYRLNDVEWDVGDSASIGRNEDLAELIHAIVEKIDARQISRTEKYLSDSLKNVPNGVYGTALLLCIAISAASILLVKGHYQHRKKAKKMGRSTKSATKCIAWCIAVLILANSVGFTAASILTQTEDESYFYGTTDFAVQKPTSILFDPPAPLPSETWPLAETLDRLHIYKNFITEESDISQRMMEKYYTEFARLYQNGSAPRNGPVLPSWIDLKRNAYQALKDDAFTAIETEVEKCRSSFRPACLYQLFRALADTVYTEYASLPFEYLVDIAADAVACGEQFLTYEDRNIESGDKILIINAEDVALMNGKIYWDLADCLEHGHTSQAPQTYDIYRNCFYVAGYQCMVQGAIQAAAGMDAEQDPEYAKLLYYVGNLGEKMVTQGRIPREDALYSQMGQDTLRYYDAVDKLLNATLS